MAQSECLIYRIDSDVWEATADGLPVSVPAARFARRLDEIAVECFRLPWDELGEEEYIHVLAEAEHDVRFWLALLTDTVPTRQRTLQLRLRSLTTLAARQPLYSLAGLLLVAWVAALVLGWLPWAHMLLAAALCAVMANMVLIALRLSAPHSGASSETAATPISADDAELPVPDGLQTRPAPRRRGPG